MVEEDERHFYPFINITTRKKFFVETVLLSNFLMRNTHHQRDGEKDPQDWRLVKKLSPPRLPIETSHDDDDEMKNKTAQKSWIVCWRVS